MKTLLHYRTYDPQTKQRGFFGRESVRAILKNPAYIGVVRCSGKEYPGIHEPLIDRDTWAHCQALRGERDHGGRGHTNRDGWLLSRIVRCASCGEHMWTHPTGRQGQLRYYYCASRDHRTCAVPLIRAEPVEAQALETVKALALPGEWQAAIMRQIAVLLQPTAAKPAISKETVEAQLKRLALMYAAGDIDEATYQRQRAAWRKQLEGSGAPILPSASNPRRAFEVLSDLPNLLDGANEAQRSVLRHIFTTVWLAPHRVAAITPTDLYAPMLAAVETLREKDGDMGCPTGFGYRIQTSSKRSPCDIHPLPTGSERYGAVRAYGFFAWTGWVSALPSTHTASDSDALSAVARNDGRRRVCFICRLIAHSFQRNCTSFTSQHFIDLYSPARGLSLPWTTA